MMTPWMPEIRVAMVTEARARDEQRVSVKVVEGGMPQAKVFLTV